MKATIGLIIPFLYPAVTLASYPLVTVKTGLCNLEVRVGEYGNGQPSSLPQKYKGQATVGQQWRGDEGQRICWRREGTPNDCASPVTPNYTCVSSSKGIQDNQPEQADIN